MLHIKYGFDWAVSDEMLDYYVNIDVYCPRSADEHLGSFFSESLIFRPTVHFLQDFSFT